MILNCDDVTIAVITRNETHQKGFVVRNIDAVFFAEVGKRAFKQRQSVFDFSFKISPMCFPCQKISDNEPFFVCSSLRKEVRVYDLMRHDKTQTSR